MKKIILLTIMLLTTSALTFGQNVKVSGVVKDATTDEGVVSASILVKGTATGTISDIDGNFSIEVEKGATLW